MSIILFAKCLDIALFEKLYAMVAAQTSDLVMETYRDFETLYARMRRLPKAVDVAVLLAMDDEQLSVLSGLKDFLDDVPLILILPDQNKENITHAAKLFPNFIGFLDSEPLFIGEVLAKIIRLQQAKRVYTTKMES